MKYLLVFLSVVILYCNANAAEKRVCTKYDGHAAEIVTDYLNSWKNMYSAYKQFKHCDDGGVAQGFSEATARLLVDDWEDLEEGVKFFEKSPDFEGFIVHHISEVNDYDDIKRIEHFAKNSCPKHAKDFCIKLKKHIQSIVLD